MAIIINEELSDVAPDQLSLLVKTSNSKMVILNERLLKKPFGIKDIVQEFEINEVNPIIVLLPVCLFSGFLFYEGTKADKSIH